MVNGCNKVVCGHMTDWFIVSCRMSPYTEPRLSNWILEILHCKSIAGKFPQEILMFVGMQFVWKNLYRARASVLRASLNVNRLRRESARLFYA